MRTITNILTSSWRGAAVPWLVVCLLGFAAGLWPDALVHPKTPSSAVPLPTLPAVAAAQVAFLLLVYPVIVLRRAGRSAAPNAAGTATEPTYKFCPGLAVMELVVLLVAAMPFAVAAAWFSDGGAADVVRTALCAAAFIPLSVGLAAWYLPARRAAWRCAAMILGLLVTTGLPAGVYLCHEFLRPAWADTLWSSAPLTLAWTHASPHAATTILPAPATACIFWLLAGLATLLAAWATETRATSDK